MPEQQDVPDAARPRTSAFEERLRGWMSASERRFEANSLANGDVLELSMLDIVGEDWWTGGGITSKGVQDKLAANPKAKTIKILLNSPGGDAFEGLAVQSLLRRHGARIEVEVVGLAASAASIIAMAGDSITMHEGSLMMIHEPWTFAVGDAAEMRTTADFLDKVNSSGLDVYTRRTGRQRSDVAELVAAETWMTAHEAVEQKFATSVAEAAAPEPAAKARAAAQAFMSARQLKRAQASAADKFAELQRIAPVEPPNTTATAAITPSAAASPTGKGPNMPETEVQQVPAASEPASVVVSGVKLLGVTTEAEATAKINEFQRLNMALMGATGASTNAEAMARVMGWKANADQVPELVKQVADLRAEANSSKKEAAIQKLSREGRLAPAQHDWARANFTSAEALETFALTLPEMAKIGAHEPDGKEGAVALTAEEKSVCALLNMSEDKFLEEKKIQSARRNARTGG
jgi:ATP-dependent Clp protease protease subunit